MIKTRFKKYIFYLLINGTAFLYVFTQRNNFIAYILFIIFITILLNILLDKDIKK